MVKGIHKKILYFLTLLLVATLNVSPSFSETLAVSTFPYEHTSQWGPNGTFLYQMNLEKGEAAQLRIQTSSGLPQDCRNSFLKLVPIDERGADLIDKSILLFQFSRLGQGNYTGAGIIAENRGTYSFRMVREDDSTSQCPTTNFPFTVTITKHTGNLIATETLAGKSGSSIKKLGFVESHEYLFQGVKGKRFAANLRLDSGTNDFCHGYTRMQLMRVGGFNSVADSIKYTASPIGNSSDPIKIDLILKSGGAYKLRIERQFSRFDTIECDDASYNYQLRLSLPKRPAQRK